MTDRQQDAAVSGHRVIAWVWSLLLLTGLVWSGWTIGQSNLRVGDLAPSAWLDGKAMAALTADLRLPGQSNLEMANAAVRYRFLGDTGTQVALGCPQWLFYRDGLRAPDHAGDGPFAQRLKLMRHWVEQLRKKNIALLVVAVPDKARIETGHLCGLSIADAQTRRFDRWEQALSQAGIPFVDLRTAMKSHESPLFFRTDVHMNADGARISASAVAAAALPLLGGEKGPQAFDIRPPGPAEPLRGDLLVLSGLIDAPQGWRPDLETVQPQQIDPIREIGLLDTAPPVEVLLAGSSNGRRSNFATWLGIGLGREVWNESMDGGQFSGAFQQVMEKASNWPPSLRLVIWEFSESALSLPLAEREKVALESLNALPAAW